MGFGQFQAGSGSGERQRRTMHTMSEINVTPMVDVMLVLLVIFILAAPLLNHAIRLELPKADAAVLPSQIETITLALDARGDLFWEVEKIDLKVLKTRLSAYAKKTHTPEILLRADKATRYENIAQVMATVQAEGLNKIGFATDAKSPELAKPELAKPAQSNKQKISLEKNE